MVHHLFPPKVVWFQPPEKKNLQLALSLRGGLGNEEIEILATLGIRGVSSSSSSSGFTSWKSEALYLQARKNLNRTRQTGGTIVFLTIIKKNQQ